MVRYVTELNVQIMRNHLMLWDDNDQRFLDFALLRLHLYILIGGFVMSSCFCCFYNLMRHTCNYSQKSLHSFRHQFHCHIMEMTTWVQRIEILKVRKCFQVTNVCDMAKSKKNLVNWIHFYTLIFITDILTNENVKWVIWSESQWAKKSKLI
jgi:hypothetical protein